MNSLMAQEPNVIPLTEGDPQATAAATSFQLLCGAAMLAAKDAGGAPPNRYNAFDGVIAAANYPKRFVLVADPKVYGPEMWWWNAFSSTNSFFGTDKDGYRYIAQTF